MLAWHFPNRKTWTPKPVAATEQGGEPHTCNCQDGDCRSDPNTIGNYYTARFSDAWDVVTRTAPHLAALEEKTVEFVNALIESDLPPVVKEAALFNLSSLRSQTCFRTPDGRFFGFEGCNDNAGCCPGSCTHVWNYEQATPFLFGALARTMREVEFHFSTDDRGLMSFRTNLPLDPGAADSGKGSGLGKAAADGQMGCLMKLYRDWQLSGDDSLLRSLWPQARKALEFCWIPGGWDADQDGVMEGCQHNTMDVEYYGPNPQMGIWYLGALRAMEEMASYLGEEAFAARCRSLFENGQAWLDEHLFNGDYYEHEIRPIQSEAGIPPGLRIGMGGTDPNGQPELQLGRGCLVDQLVGQYVAHVCDLGYLVDENHIRKALQSVMAFNFRPSFFNHFNHLRTFVLNDEAALVMASYPRGERPRRPFPYFNEVMTGFEYCAGVHMLYEGQQDNGLKVIKAIRSRYDGLRRSPFDEAECGHHYARAMASWAAILALTGFHYSGVEKRMTFGRMDSPGQWLWSTGDAWGLCHQQTEKKHVEMILEVKGGKVSIGNVTISGFGTVDLSEAVTLEGGDRVKITVKAD